MKVLFQLAFGVGLAVAVYAMLHGVERNRAAGITRPPSYLNLPAIAAFMVVFGAVGYLLLGNSHLSALVIAVLALFSGALGWFGMGLLMAKWALRPTGSSAHDEAEKIQGLLAVVVNAIAANDPGTIRYGPPGAMHSVAARSIDASPLGPGTEVVIDRLENGVAIVETWASVEERL